MGGKRLKFHDLRRILGTFGVVEDHTTGDHVVFAKGNRSYPIPKKKDVNPVYVKGARRKFGLTPADGVSDADLFSR